MLSFGVSQDLQDYIEKVPDHDGQNWCPLKHSCSDCEAPHYYFMIESSSVCQTVDGTIVYYCMRVISMLVTRYLPKGSLLPWIQGNNKDRGQRTRRKNQSEWSYHSQLVKIMTVCSFRLRTATIDLWESVLCCEEAHYKSFRDSLLLWHLKHVANPVILLIYV